MFADEHGISENDKGRPNAVCRLVGDSSFYDPKTHDPPTEDDCLLNSMLRDLQKQSFWHTTACNVLIDLS